MNSIDSIQWKQWMASSYIGSSSTRQYFDVFFTYIHTQKAASIYLQEMRKTRKEKEFIWFALLCLFFVYVGEYNVRLSKAKHLTALISSETLNIMQLRQRLITMRQRKWILLCFSFKCLFCMGIWVCMRAAYEWKSEWVNAKRNMHASLSLYRDHWSEPLKNGMYKYVQRWKGNRITKHHFFPYTFSFKTNCCSLSYPMLHWGNFFALFGFLSNDYAKWSLL